MMKVLIGSALLALVFGGCSVTPPQHGERQRVDDSGDRPDWVGKAQDSWEEDGRIFFKSSLTDQTDLSMGLEAAKAKGIKEVAERVSMHISTDLGYTERGSSSNPSAATRFLSSAVAAQTDKLRLGGFRSEETYWERYMVSHASGVGYMYDIHRSFSVTKADYAEARQAVLDRARGLALEAMDRRAEATIDSLMQRNMGEGR